MSDIDDDGEIVTGTYADLDECRKRLDTYHELSLIYYDKIKGAILGSLHSTAKEDWVKRDGDDFACTPKRFPILLKILKKLEPVVVSSTSTAVKFTLSEYTEKKAAHGNARVMYDAINAKRTYELSRQILKDVSEHVRTVSHAMSYLDVITSFAKDAVENGMVKPTLIVPNTTNSNNNTNHGLHIEDMRHPIAERVSKVPYVKNSLTLSDDGLRGMLLYGINSAGKSTLSKGIALIVYMAQVGMYVPCSSIVFTIFDSIFTRMASRDDLVRGKSTFIVELSELRNIFTSLESSNSSKRTLVIGDELCSGTESASAVAIVGAACMKLLKSTNTYFIFATHLHELAKLFSSKENIKPFHLSFEYSKIKDEFVYNRKLVEGSGKSLYGLEVARSMHMGAEFMEDANNIRRHMLSIRDVLVREKKSNYNSGVYMDTCRSCGVRDAVETHHVIPQGDFVGNWDKAKKNASWNLVPLCSACHDLIHV
jgi:DNA mismatch repair protein MutS